MDAEAALAAARAATEALLASQAVREAFEQRGAVLAAAATRRPGARLRPLQAEAVWAACRRPHDVLVSAVTGGGKTMIAPCIASITGRLVIVIIPLSRIARQTEECASRVLGNANVLRLPFRATEAAPALLAFLAARAAVHPGDRRGACLIAHAESIASDAALQALRLHAGLFSHVALDEAALAYEWGWDGEGVSNPWRPAFGRLPLVASALATQRRARPPFLLLDGALTPNVEGELCRAAGIDRQRLVRVEGPLDRPALHLTMVHRSPGSQHLATEVVDLVREHKSGMVFVNTVSQGEAAVTAIGVAMSMAAGEGPGAPGGAVELFVGGGRRTEGELDGILARLGDTTSVVVSTVAAAYGADTAGVRFVYDWRPASTVAAWWQRCGRAAREGGRAHVVGCSSWSSRCYNVQLAIAARRGCGHTDHGWHHELSGLERIRRSRLCLHAAVVGELRPGAAPAAPCVTACERCAAAAGGGAAIATGGGDFGGGIATTFEARVVRALRGFLAGTTTGVARVQSAMEHLGTMMTGARAESLVQTLLCAGVLRDRPSAELLRGAASASGGAPKAVPHSRWDVGLAPSARLLTDAEWVARAKWYGWVAGREKKRKRTP